MSFGGGGSVGKTSFEIQVSKLSEWSPEAAAGFSKSLMEATEGKGYDFEIRADSNGVSFCIELEAISIVSQQVLLSITRAFYPSALVRVYDVHEPEYPYYQGYIAIGRTNNPNFSFITSVMKFGSFDPLTVVTQAVAGLEKGESIGYFVRVQESNVTTDAEVHKLLTISAYDAGSRTIMPYIYKPNPFLAAAAILGKLLGDRSLKKQHLNYYSDSETRDYEAKLKQRTAKVDILLSFRTPNKARLNVLTALAGAVTNLVTSGTTRLVSAAPQFQYIRTPQDKEKHDIAAYYEAIASGKGDTVDKLWLWLTADELGALWHLPHSGFSSQPITWASDLPSGLFKDHQTNSLHVGSMGKGSATPVYISREDRQYQTYISGKTGTGKSTLIKNFVKQDIAVGEGVAVIDPSGLLIKDILNDCIPAERIDDVVLLSCGNEAYPVPINPFHIAAGIEADEQLQAVLWLMKSLYKEHWSTTRMETTMRNILQLVLADRQATPLDIQEVLDNPRWRKRLLSRLRENNKLATSTERFWERFDNLSPSQQSEYVQPILNRLGFLGSPHLELITCHPNTIDFRQLIREKKIVLIDLSGNVIASEVGMLGAIFLFDLFFASQSLFFGSQQTAHPFYLYADEVQNYVSVDLTKILTEARKFGLWVTLANQYIGKLDNEAQDAIKNNVGTKITFELGDEEARATARLYEPEITAKDIASLGVGNAVIRTRYSGKTLNPFIIHTLPSPKPTHPYVTKEMIAEQSRQNLGLLPATNVREWIKKRYSGDEPEQLTGLRDFE
jgi:hypothetical protein